MIRVSTPHRSYAQERFIFVEHHDHDVEVVQERDLGSVWNGVLYRATHRMSNLYTIHTTPPFSRVDLFHLYNACSVSRRPWVVTVENWPFGRFGPIDRATYVAGDPCRRVLAISQWVCNHYGRLLGDSSLGERILDKLTLLPPPQRLLPRDGPVADDVVRLCFVGAAFFRKGGLELLRAFEAVRGRNPQLRLEVVSSLATDSYPPETAFGAVDVAEAERLLARNADRVTWHRTLPNAAVLELFTRCDVGFLPSFFDTYGFSVLEMQAAGLPVVATNQRALPELVTPERGWIVSLPLDETSTVPRSTESQRTRASAELVDGLVAVLDEIAAAPERLRERGQRARAYIRTTHDPERYAARLRKIYAEALSMSAEP